jgi:hypothetical protein
MIRERSDAGQIQNFDVGGFFGFGGLHGNHPGCRGGGVGMLQFCPVQKLLPDSIVLQPGLCTVSDAELAD